MEAKIKVHDPKALENTKKIFGDKITYTTTLSNALKNSQCSIIMTHWKQYEQLNNNLIQSLSFF